MNDESRVMTLIVCKDRSNVYSNHTSGVTKISLKCPVCKSTGHEVASLDLDIRIDILRLKSL